VSCKFPNGFDEEDFKDLPSCGAVLRLNGRAIRLLHTGLVLPGRARPQGVFCGTRETQGSRSDRRTQLRIDLRASGSEEYYSEMLKALQIADLVHLLPPLPYREALQDSVDADGLLLSKGFPAIIRSRPRLTNTFALGSQF